MPLHQSSGRWRLGLALSLLTTFLWGLTPIALKVTLQAFDAYTVTWFRFLMAFGLLAVYSTVRQQLPTPTKLRLTPLWLLLSATVCLGLNYLFYLQGVDRTSPANAQVLFQLGYVLMGLGALTIFKERYQLHQWLGMAVLSLGLALFFHEQLRTLITAPTSYLVGSGLLILSAVSWAVYALAQKQLLQRLSSTNVMLLLYGGCTLLLTPFAAPQQILSAIETSHFTFQLGMLLFCGLNTLVAYGAFAAALEHWEASRVSAIVSLTPIVTLGAVWVASFLTPTLLAPENLTSLGLVGAVLVVSGSIALALGKTER